MLHLELKNSKNRICNQFIAKRSLISGLNSFIQWSWERDRLERIKRGILLGQVPGKVVIFRRLLKKLYQMLIASITDWSLWLFRVQPEVSWTYSNPMISSAHKGQTQLRKDNQVHSWWWHRGQIIWWTDSFTKKWFNLRKLNLTSLLSSLKELIKFLRHHKFKPTVHLVMQMG